LLCLNLLSNFASAVSTSSRPFHHGATSFQPSPRVSHRYFYGSPVLLGGGGGPPVIRVTSTRRGRLLSPQGMHPDDAALLHFSSLDAPGPVDQSLSPSPLLDARGFDYPKEPTYERTHNHVSERPTLIGSPHFTEQPTAIGSLRLPERSAVSGSSLVSERPSMSGSRQPTERPLSGDNATLSAEEFSDILLSFQLDALRATQLAEQYGLLREGAGAHLTQMLEGAHASPSEEGALALPLTDTSNNFIRPLTAPMPPPADFPQLPPDFDPESSSSRADHMLFRPPGSGRLSTETARFFRGSQDMCYTGSCEFFMRCWMGGGHIEAGCGGFLFACCSRLGRSNSDGANPQNIYGDESRSLGPVDYGPVINEPGCGLPDTSRMAQNRVVGGTEAGFGSFPWQAYIRIGSSRCGGSLINRNHVVTAGHCVARARPGQIRVTLGDYVLNSDQEPLRERVYRASDIKVHPRFKFTPQADRYDVAVIRLDVPVLYQPHIQPICLPEKGTDYLGLYGWAAGWGAMQAGSRVRPKTLQTVDVPVINSQLCENWHRQKGINVIIHPEMMCAGYTNGGKDSCQGDSGGPLNMQVGGRWYLSGIVSAGYSCARARQPGIYHRVAYTSDWISWAASS